MSDAGINWGEVLDEAANDNVSKPAPDGEYEIVVSSAEATTASTGSPMIKVTVDITSGPFKGKRVWDNIVLNSNSPVAMRISLQNLAALGVNREWIASTNPSIAQLVDAINGAEAIAILGTKTWNDEPRNEVKKYKPNTGTVPAPPTIASSTPAPTSPASAPPPPSASNDVPPPPSIPSGEGVRPPEDPF